MPKRFDVVEESRAGSLIAASHNVIASYERSRKVASRALALCPRLLGSGHPHRGVLESRACLPAISLPDISRSG